MQYLTPIKSQIRSNSILGDEYSTAKSHYQQTFDNKLMDSKSINNIRSKEIRDKERVKEYSYPPLPNLVNAKKAFLKNKVATRNLSPLVDAYKDKEE